MQVYPNSFDLQRHLRTVLANEVGPIESNKLIAFLDPDVIFPSRQYRQVPGVGPASGQMAEGKCGAGKCDGARTPQWPPDRSEDFSRRITFIGTSHLHHIYISLHLPLSTT